MDHTIPYLLEVCLLCKHIGINLTKVYQTFASFFPLFSGTAHHNVNGNGKKRCGQIPLDLGGQLDIRGPLFSDLIDQRTLKTSQQVNPGEFQLQERKMCYLKEFWHLLS
jgi:hypothetical protein